MSQFPDELWIVNKNGSPVGWFDEKLNDNDVRYVKATPLTDSAPDLLEALHEVMSWIDNWNPDFTFENEWADTEIKARAAIKKAMGAAEILFT